MSLGFIGFLLLGTFPGWHEEVDEDGSEREVKPFPSRPVSQTALGLYVIAALFAFISGLLQHIASSTGSVMVQALTYGTANGHVGPAAMVLGWIAIFLYFLVAAALAIMIQSIRLLAERFGDV